MYSAVDMQGQGHHVAYQTVPPQPLHQKTIKGLAITQLVIGILSFLWSIVPGFQHWIWFNATGGGIGAGIFIIIAGILGVVHARTCANRCLEGTYMAFSIISTVASGIAAIVFITHVGNLSVFCDYGQCSIGYAVFVPLMILMVVEFFVSIVASVYCCKSCCGVHHGEAGVILQQPQVVMNAPANPQAYPPAYAPHHEAQFVPQYHVQTPHHGVPQEKHHGGHHGGHH